MGKSAILIIVIFILAAIGQVACFKTPGNPQALDPGKMAHVGAVDERFQSFNVEMIEVTAADSGSLIRVSRPR